MDTPRRRNVRRIALAVTLSSLVWLVVVLVTGGFSFRLGVVTVASHRPWLPLVLAVISLGVAAVGSTGSALRDDLAAAWDSLDRAASWFAIAAAVAALVCGIRWGTWVAGGSDSYCYLSQAVLLARGTVHAPPPIPQPVPWPSSALTFAPTGYVPSGTVPGASVPICPAGLSATMAVAAIVFGPSAVFLVVPVLGGVVVWLTFILGRRVSTPRAAAVSAILVASSPILLFQIVQPMSDVPATAWWLAALALAGRPGIRSSILSGLAASMAVFTRPNLIPLAFVIAAAVAATAVADMPRGDRKTKPIFALNASVVRSVIGFGVALVPGIVATLLIQRAMHGSPFQSGYGRLETLFALAYVGTNAPRYLRWLVETHTPFVALALFAPFIGSFQQAAGATTARAHVWMYLAFIVTTVACYLPYLPFDDWSYLRFLLPALPLVILLSTAVVASALEWFPVPARAFALALFCAWLASSYVRAADRREAFNLQNLERRFADTGQYIAQRLPDRAVVFTVWESGSVRYYSGRPTLVWDSLDPAWLDKALAFLRAQGYTPYFLFEDSEEPAFRARFAGQSELGALDWPPRAQIGHIVRLYDPADRSRFRAGETIQTERVWPAER